MFAPRARLCMITAACLAVTSAIAASGQTPADLAREQYAVDGQHSTVGFTSRILGLVKVRGRFGDYDIAVTYDSAHLERSSVTAIIASKSISTDMEFRDNHLRSPDFFDTEKYPTIEFRSEHVVRRPGGVLVTGPLTMHGVTRPVSFTARITALPAIPKSGMTRVEFEASLRLSRAAFGIAGTNQFNPDYDPATSLLADSVDITFELYAIRPGYRDLPFGRGTPPGVGDTLLTIVQARGAAAAAAAYQTLRAERPAAFNYRPRQLDVLARALVDRGRVADALPIFRLNAEVNGTQQAAIIESLGYGEALNGNREAALAAYRHAAEMSPRSASAQEMIKRLTALGN